MCEREKEREREREGGREGERFSYMILMEFIETLFAQGAPGGDKMQGVIFARFMERSSQIFRLQNYCKLNLSL